LEREEEQIREIEGNEIEMTDSDDEWLMKEFEKVKGKIKLKWQEHILKKGNTLWKKNISAEELAEGLDLDIEKVKERASKWKTLAELMGVKRKRGKGEEGDMDVDDSDEENKMDMDQEEQPLRERLRQRKIDFALGRMEGANPREHSLKWFDEAEDRMRKKIEKWLWKTTQIHESDRKVTDSKPRHLFAGKRGNGKTDRR